MKRLFVWSIILSFAFAQPVWAAKGGKGGGGYKQQWSDGMHEAPHRGQGKDTSMEPVREKPDEASGFAKQREKKLDQERKEIGKGSETGQQQREEKSRKWWKFWE